MLKAEYGVALTLLCIVKYACVGNTETVELGYCCANAYGTVVAAVVVGQYGYICAEETLVPELPDFDALMASGKCGKVAVVYPD